MEVKQGNKKETLTQTGRRGRDWQLGRQDSRKGGGWWTQQGGVYGVVWAKMQLACEAAAGGPGDRQCNPGLQGNKASNLWLKTPVGVEAAAGETPSLTGEFLGETHRGLERAQAHPLGNQRQKGPIWLWVAEGLTNIQQRVEQAPLLSLGPSPTYSVTKQRPVLPGPGEHLRLSPFK